MQAEVLRVEAFALRSEAQKQRGRIILGRKDKSCRVAAGIVCGAIDLIRGEVLKAVDLIGRFYVAEFWLREFIAYGPCRKDGGSGESPVQLRDSGHVQPNYACVFQVIFRRKPVGRVDKQAGDKCCS